MLYILFAAQRAIAIGFLYYAGHGAPDHDTNLNYLIPVDVAKVGSALKAALNDQMGRARKLRAHLSPCTTTAKKHWLSDTLLAAQQAQMAHFMA